MLRRLQWVALGGFACSVMWTTCVIFSGVNGLTRDGRVASVYPLRHGAAAPATDRQQALVHSRRNPSAVSPSLANNTIRALQTAFCAVFRSRTNRSNRSRSAALIPISSIFLIGADAQVRADL
jgi:hypothetical protein